MPTIQGRAAPPLLPPCTLEPLLCFPPAAVVALQHAPPPFAPVPLVPNHLACWPSVYPASFSAASFFLWLSFSTNLRGFTRSASTATSNKPLPSHLADFMRVPHCFDPPTTLECTNFERFLTAALQCQRVQCRSNWSRRRGGAGGTSAERCRRVARWQEASLPRAACWCTSTGLLLLPLKCLGVEGLY